MTTSHRVVRRPDSTLVVYGESRQHSYKLAQLTVSAVEQRAGMPLDFISEQDLLAALKALGLSSLALDAADMALLPADRPAAASSPSTSGRASTANPADATVVLPGKSPSTPGVSPAPRQASGQPSPQTLGNAPTVQMPGTLPPPRTGQPASGPPASGQPPAPPADNSPSGRGPGRGAGLLVGLIAAGVVLIVFFLVVRFVAGPRVPATPTLPPLPSLTPLAPTAAPGLPAVTARSDTPVLAGPGPAYPVVGMLPAGQSSEAIGTSADGQWWVIRFPGAPDRQGWVQAGMVTATNTGSLPVVPAPQLPTATPSPSPSATPTAVQTPVAVITGPVQGQVGQQIQFSARDSKAGSNARLVSYEWNFGDQTLSSGIDVTKIYEQPGSFTITLTVVDSNNLGSQATQTISISPAPATATPIPPRAVISAPAQAQAGQSVTFDGSGSTSSSPIDAYGWTFGDGTVASGPRVAHVYANTGAFNVTLTIVDRNGQQNTAAVPISILPAPTVEPTATPTQAPPALAGTNWSLQAYDKSDAGLSPLVPATTITAQFGQDGKLAGSSGCNTYQTTYQTGAADSIVIMLPVASGMQCGEPAGVMEQEQTYLGLLPQVTTYRLNGNRLEMLNGMGKILLQYGR